jgi:hypothetical protein
VALRITEEQITSDLTTVRAVHVGDCWRVFGHPDLTDSADLDRNAAITAMTLAEVYAQDPPKDDRIWLFVEAWREELDL